MAIELWDGIKTALSMIVIPVVIYVNKLENMIHANANQNTMTSKDLKSLEQRVKINEEKHDKILTFYHNIDKNQSAQLVMLKSLQGDIHDIKKLLTPPKKSD